LGVDVRQAFVNTGELSSRSVAAHVVNVC
jgi:hypothetical protein